MLETNELTAAQEDRIADKIADRLAAKRPARRQRDRKAIRYLEEEELRALFAAVAGDVRDRAIFEVAYHRGLRAAEVGRLNLVRLRLRDRRLFVERVKHGISAEYVLTKREIDALKPWLRKRGNDPGPLFPSRNHRAISTRRLDALMKRYAADAGLPQEKRHFHCLRHSCATTLRRMGVSIEDIQDHLGHVDIRSTTIYATMISVKRAELGDRLHGAW